MYLASFRAGGDSRAAELVTISRGGHPPTPAGSRASVVPETELESLTKVAPRWSRELGVSPALVGHAIREAKGSRLYGETPETWSHTRQRVMISQRLHGGNRGSDLVDRCEESGRDLHPTASFDITLGSAKSSSVVSLEVAGERAAVFAYDGAVVRCPLPQSVDTLEITVVDDVADDRTWSQLRAAMPDGDRETVVVWRCTPGRNLDSRRCLELSVRARIRLGSPWARSRGLVVGASSARRQQEAEHERRATRSAEAASRWPSGAIGKSPKHAHGSPTYPPRLGAVSWYHGTMSTALSARQRRSRYHRRRPDAARGTSTTRGSGSRPTPRNSPAS